MTTDLDRTALLEFTAAAYVSYALRKEPTMTTTFTITCHDCHGTGTNGWDFPCRNCNALSDQFKAQGRTMPEAFAPTSRHANTTVVDGQIMMHHDVGMYCECPDCTGDDRPRSTAFAPFINEWGEIDGIGAHEEDCSQHIGGICDCGEPIPDEGDYCHDCAQERVPEEVKAMKPYRTLIALAALALSLTTHTAHAADTLTYESQHGRGTLTLPYIGTPAYSDSCTITHAWEDHSAIAYCTEDGATYHYDPDGDITTGKEPGWYAD
jgi:hypothetical protein